MLEEVVKQSPKDPHAWYNLGLLYKNSSDSAKRGQRVSQCRRD